MPNHRNAVLALLSPLVLVLAIAGCGGSSSSSSSSSTPSGPGGTAGAATSAPAAGGSGALSAEATSAATGDIPDSQVFLVYRDRGAGYSMRYPEGWAQRGGGDSVTIADKNNLVQITIRTAPAPTTASVAAELARLRAQTPSLVAGRPAPTTLTKAGPAIRATYSTLSAPNPVTNKRVLLLVDRYEFPHNGRVATVDLGTPKGVDNVDAYKMMINSFQWN